jgi:carbon-monoxide dehydrogenase large subunit
VSVKATPWIGLSVERLEDRPLLTGRGRFAGDVSFPHQLHMRVVRSPYAHGRLKSIDASQAIRLPGVVAVWTADDIADLGPIDFREARTRSWRRSVNPCLPGSWCVMRASR